MNPDCVPADSAGTAGAGAAGAALGAAAAAGGAGGTAAARMTTDGVNTGNSPEALRAAKDAASVMQQAKIQVSATATLVPATGGATKQAALRRYRASVTGAVLVIKLDQTALPQWTSAGAKVQGQLLRSFLSRLAKTYRSASRSITVVDPSGTVLAFGDAAGRGNGTIKLYK